MSGGRPDSPMVLRGLNPMPVRFDHMGVGLIASSSFTRARIPEIAWACKFVCPSGRPLLERPRRDLILRLAREKPELQRAQAPIARSSSSLQTAGSPTTTATGPATVAIHRRDLLGGLIHEYQRAA
jgi:hypothetical protein